MTTQTNDPSSGDKPTASSDRNPIPAWYDSIGAVMFVILAACATLVFFRNLGLWLHWWN